MTLRALDRRTCQHHGAASLFLNSVCVSCVREFGVAADTRAKKPIEPIPEWMKKAILGISGPAPVTSRRSSGVRGFVHEMSDMERYVFESLGRGVRPIEITQQLDVSFSAVSNAITRLQDKCCVGSRQQLRQMARAALLKKRAAAC